MGIDGIIVFRLGFPILIIIEIIRYIKANLLNRKFNKFRELAIIVFSIYIMELIYITIFPLNINPSIYEPTVHIVPVSTMFNDMSQALSSMDSFMIKFCIILSVFINVYR